ncbi:hypothetical protein B0H66DRAFT_528296 [Apodospora peruviana]|uniref:Uncharacterized protein n=1 Tax=Apodospora peruviana TaxID=516989 RepID=A0AAE0IU07_9PEZI|nr:hypothetical protein B0H66DRAFT_528296 [Apodospora peruviana]
MATIEPRLIHLLNNSQPSNRPPGQHLPSLGTSGPPVSLPPIEFESAPPVQSSSTQHPSYYTWVDEGPATHAARADNGFSSESGTRNAISSRPLQSLHGEPEVNVHTLPLRMFVEDTAGVTEDPSTKKRHMALTTKDDFVQLPQPLKKQKSTQQVVPPVPPIINGLHEPPPNAAVFPPISARAFDTREAPELPALREPSNNAEDWNGTAPMSDVDRGIDYPRVKRRAAKPRRKWSEEETNHLLLGVSRHGVGKWTSILDDPDFKFNERTAGDLKDRFRTCCPEELRGMTGAKKRSNNDNNVSYGYSTHDDKWKSKNGLGLENALTDQERPGEKEDESAPNKQRKSRAHRKKMEDLEELGIRGPFKKSVRRERRPFSEQDDKEILDGLDHYGPAWTKIQRDPKYNLSSRQPTDLRDRVRNKYPEIYAKIEKGSFQVTDAVVHHVPSKGVLEPSLSTNMSTSFGSTMPAVSASSLEPALTRASSRDDMSRWRVANGLPPWETTESPRAHSDPFITDPSSSFLHNTAPEMGIGRLLQDDARVGPAETDRSRSHGRWP